MSEELNIISTLTKFGEGKSKQFFFIFVGGSLETFLGGGGAIKIKSPSSSGAKAK